MAVLALGTCASDSQSAELCAPESGLVEALGDCAKIMNSLIATKLLGIVFAKGVQGATVATDLALMSRQLLESGELIFRSILNRDGVGFNVMELGSKW